MLLKSDLDVQQTHLSLLNKSSCLAPALSVTKLTNVRDMILVTLCCPTQVQLRCSTNPPQNLTWFCWTSKSDLSSTLPLSKWHQTNHSVYKYCALNVNKSALNWTKVCQLHLNPIARKIVPAKKMELSMSFCPTNWPQANLKPPKRTVKKRCHVGCVNDA